LKVEFLHEKQKYATRNIRTNHAR